MKRLDWKLLLGFDQLGDRRDRKAIGNSRISGKIGGKSCLTRQPESKS